MEIIIIKPLDFHHHLRQHKMLNFSAQEAEKVYAGVLAMPNTVPPITTPGQLETYLKVIEEAAPSLKIFPTFRVMPDMSEQSVKGLAKAGAVAGKFYPEGATTNSEGGGNISSCYHVFEAMEKHGIVLSIHGEDPEAFVLQREAAFLPHIEKVHSAFPKLKIIVEHVSTKEAVRFVESCSENVAATITAHHLSLTLDNVIGGLIEPHNFCKPVVKTPEDRFAIQKAAIKGKGKFFFGSDSAPHPRNRKESEAGPAGVFTTPVAVPAVAEIFEKHNSLSELENFLHYWGAAFYGVEGTADKVTLAKEKWTVPEEYNGVVPLFAGKTLQWKLK